jgi:endonuclease III
VARLTRLLDSLEAFYGPQVPQWPTDPYEFLVWWQCGYPPSEERCRSGWQSLTEKLGGVSASELLSARKTTLVGALRAGGMIPEVRATRLAAIARRVCDEYGDELKAALARLPVAQARAALKKFPGIGDPGADRIVLFGNLATVAAVPSASPYVIVRLQSGPESADYRATYRQSQNVLEKELPQSFPALTRAYLLLQQHGQQLCKRTRPRCGECPVASSCAYFRRRAPTRHEPVKAHRTLAASEKLARRRYRSPRPR